MLYASTNVAIVGSFCCLHERALLMPRREPQGSRTGLAAGSTAGVFFCHLCQHNGVCICWRASFALYLCFLGIYKCVWRQFLAIRSYCMLTRHTHTSCVFRVHHFISRALPLFQASPPCPVAPKLEVGARRPWTDDRSGLYRGNRGNCAVSPVLPYCSCVSVCNNWSRTTTFVTKTRCLAHFTVCVCVCVYVWVCVCVCVCVYQ